MAKRDTAKKGFVLGDHTFLHPSVNGPLSRLNKPARQIRGAPPPMLLEGMTRDAGKASMAAKELLKGKFQGHGEPTIAIFDIVLEGEEELEIGAIDGAEDGGYTLVAVRRPGGTWRAVYRAEWAAGQATLEGVQAKPVSAKEAAAMQTDEGRVAVGLEYPCDATSRDSVTWITVDILPKGKRKPICVASAELA